MPKKSKQNVKQIPAKVGAKTKTKSGDKVEVVLNTTKIVKDRTRGKYKPRKKTKKPKQPQDESLSLLRQQIELEKLRRQQEAVRFEPAQRFRNNRTGNDINQFFNKQSKNDGTKEVVSELSKQVKQLREQITKKDETPKEQPQEEPKSKFVQELETTQNEIQRQRIQRGIARRDEEQKRKSEQRRIEDFERKENAERLRRERGREAERKQRTALQQSRSATIEQFERKEIEDREKQLQLERDIKKREKQQLELQEAIKKENERRTEEAKKKSEQLRKQISNVREQIREEDKPKQKPQPEPESSSVASTILSDFESTHASDFNQPSSSNPIHRQRTIQQVSKDIVANLNNEPLLQRERQRQIREQDSVERPPRQRPVLKLSQSKKSIDDVDDLLFDSADEFEDVSEVEPKNDSVPKSVAKDIVSGGLEKIEKREKNIENVSSLLSEQVIEEALDELTEEQRKQRRRSFKNEAEEKEKTKSQLRQEAEKLRELQIEGDKAYQDRLKAQEQIEKDERIARDLLLQEARKRDLKIAENEKLDKVLNELKEKKLKEKKKARDNIRKREQQEFLDEIAGEIISGAVSEAQTRRESKSLVESAIGSSLANEVITATQKIPRKPREQAKVKEKIGNLLHSDYTRSEGRRAYSEQDAKRKYELNKESSNLKEKIALLFPKYVKQNMFKPKQSLQTSNATIQSIMDKVKQDGELTGMQAVKLKRLLDELASMLQEIVNIENKYRDRRTGKNKPPRETEDERRLRIRREQSERFNVVEEEEDEDED